MRSRSHLDVRYGDRAMGWVGFIGLWIVGLIVLLVRAQGPAPIVPDPQPERIAVLTTTTSTTAPSTTTSTTVATTTTSARILGWSWDELAACESGGRWHIHDSVHQGGLQFAVSTWDAYAPAGYPEDAHLASREQQIVVAELVLEDQGPGAWPVCSRKVGMR